MKGLIFFACILLIFGCNEKSTNTTGEAIDSASKVIKLREDTRFKSLLDKFRDIEFDTLKVYSPNDSLNEYRGKELTSAEMALFPADVARPEHFVQQLIYAVYKFPLDEKRYGLLARTPAMYSPTSIKLLAFDAEVDSITSWIELGERWGDAGDFQYKTSWIFGDTSERKAFLWEELGNYHDAGNPADTGLTVTHKHFLLNFAKSLRDTAKTADEDLQKKYGHLKTKANGSPE